MKNTRLIVKGGVISPGELREIVNMSLAQGLKAISFGSRQDIIFPENFVPAEVEKAGKHHFVLPDTNSGNNIV
ncbi:MAG TPA: rubredoxin, partial [Flavobacterium sp.]|nr:rubredoxin [Flavobacterium sp.]